MVSELLYLKLKFLNSNPEKLMPLARLAVQKLGPGRYKIAGGLGNATLRPRLAPDEGLRFTNTPLSRVR